MAVAKSFAKIRTLTARRTDKRIRQLSETIDGIASVKSYGWEVPFFLYISELRDDECRAIRMSQILRCMNWTLYFCIPPLAGFALFSVFWATGGTLTLPIVFSSISLLHVLRTAVGRMWTRAMETGSEAIACSSRIDQFLALGYGNCTGDSNEIIRSCKHDLENNGCTEDGEASEVLLSVGLTSFSYPKRNQPALSNINLSLSKGELLMVVGPVGAVF